MNIGKFPKEFHGIVEEKKGMGDEKATPLDSGFWMVDGERKRKGWGGNKEKSGKGNPVFLLALVRAAKSLRNRREPDKFAAKQVAISWNDETGSWAA